MSLQGWLHVGLVPCRDMNFCVTTVGLQCGTEVYRDKGFPVAAESTRLVSRHSLVVSRQGSWLGGVVTESARQRTTAHDSVQLQSAIVCNYARDRM